MLLQKKNQLQGINSNSTSAHCSLVSYNTTGGFMYRPSRSKVLKTKRTASRIIRYLFRLKFPVVNDTCRDDGGVVPVAAVAVVLSRVVTLPRLARDASYRIKHSTDSCKFDLYLQIHVNSCIFMILIIFIYLYICNLLLKVTQASQQARSYCMTSQTSNGLG